MCGQKSDPPIGLRVTAVRRSSAALCHQTRCAPRTVFRYRSRKSRSSRARYRLNISNPTKKATISGGMTTPPQMPRGAVVGLTIRINRDIENIAPPIRKTKASQTALNTRTKFRNRNIQRMRVWLLSSRRVAESMVLNELPYQIRFRARREVSLTVPMIGRPPNIIKGRSNSIRNRLTHSSRGRGEISSASSELIKPIPWNNVTLKALKSRCYARCSCRQTPAPARRRRDA